MKNKIIDASALNRNEETMEVENENCYPMVAPGRSNSQMLGLDESNDQKP